MKDSVAILLSTYNGELYIEDQIHSILSQDFKNWILYIRDDGSTDLTVEIIKRYTQKYGNINFQEDKESKGAALSFLYLLQNVDSKYYLFCDQDDVWLPDKISKLYNKIKSVEINCEKSVLVFSDAKVVDQNLTVIDDSFWHYHKVHPKLLLSNKKYINVFNSTPGCTMLFNQELKTHIDFGAKNILMHDWYLMIIALQQGCIAYVNTPLMLYRQHQNNTVGAHKTNLKRYFLKLKNLKKTIYLQMDNIRFVQQFTRIGIFEFYKLKILFNFSRFK